MSEKEDISKALRSTKPGFKRLIALMCEGDVPIEGLAKACRSPDWMERAAVARNKKTPKNILNILAEDADVVVRTLAQSNMGGFKKRKQSGSNYLE